jgi:RNA polymerase sigma-70 factor (ECF subfamily)
MATHVPKVGGATFEQELERHRRELTAYCYRMLGAGSEAEDAVQDTFLRAWRNQDSFEGRSSLRAWLYRIATNVCLDMLQGPQRRARPMDMVASTTADTPLPGALPEHAWIEPIADARVLPDGGDPAELASARETVRLAFVAALQHLPPRQRAVLILREVLRWQASEVAELLDTTTASVNSALQRSRATLDEMQLDAGGPATVDDAEQRELLDRYVDAFERYDMGALVSLLREDVEFSMPPFPMWLSGPVEVERWLLGQGSVCRGSRVVKTSANGLPAYGAYHPTPDGYEPFALVVLEIAGGRITGIHNFLNTALFAQFGLPPRLER